jgi:hypothetical protein
MIKEATRDKPGFLEHSKLSRGTGGSSRRFFESNVPASSQSENCFVSPIFVALGDETDMEDNRYKYHARPML